jgi:hypothetical protein
VTEVSRYLEAKREVEALYEEIRGRLPAGSPARIRWLLDRLDGVIHIFVGFCEAPHSSMKALVDESKLVFLMLEFTSLLLDELRLLGASEALLAECLDFELSLRRLSATSSKEVGRVLLDNLMRLQLRIESDLS